MSDLTDVLDGATGENALQDAVARVRTAAAYLLLTDSDAALHMLRYLYKFIVDDIGAALDYIEQLEDILHTRITVGAAVDFSQDIEDLGRLNSVRTQVGAVVQSRILDHINAMGSAINGVQLNSLIARVTAIRPGLDTALARAVGGMLQLVSSTTEYSTDAAEAYYTTTRSRVVQGYLSSAQRAAIEGNYDEVMRYMAASVAGLTIPQGVGFGEKAPVTASPSRFGAHPVVVHGTAPVFPMFNDESLELVLLIDGTAVSLPLPLSPAAEARTVPLPTSITFPLEVQEVLDYPGGSMTAVFPAGTYTPGDVRAIFDAASPYGATLDSSNIVHVIGARGPGAFFTVNTMASTADSVFQMSCYPGRNLTADDVVDAWAGTPVTGVSLLDGGGGVAALSVGGCLVLGIPASSGQAKLRLPIGTCTAFVSAVSGTGLTVGDLVYGSGPTPAEVLRRFDGFWSLSTAIQVPESGQLRVESPASLQHMRVVGQFRRAEVLLYLEYFKDGLPSREWNKILHLLPLADRSEALRTLSTLADRLREAKTTLRSYAPSPVPDVDKLFSRMEVYGLDLAARYLASMQFDLFFTAPVSQLSSIGRIAVLGQDVLSSLETLER